MPTIMLSNQYLKQQKRGKIRQSSFTSTNSYHFGSKRKLRSRDSSSISSQSATEREIVITEVGESQLDYTPKNKSKTLKGLIGL